MMAKISLSPPWVVRYRELDALFKEDPGVHVFFDEDKPEIKLCVEDENKATALYELLEEKVEYGNVTLKITVVPANGVTLTKAAAGATVAELLVTAFDGNKAVSFIKNGTPPFTIGMVFIVFKKKVVQYYTDDIGDIYGFHSALYEQLAEKIFPPHENVHFCTDIVDDGVLGATLGKWP